VDVCVRGKRATVGKGGECWGRERQGDGKDKGTNVLTPNNARLNFHQCAEQCRGDRNLGGRGGQTKKKEFVDSGP